MVQATPVDSGTVKRSWTPVSRESGGPVERRSVGYSFGNIQPYAHVLDTGSLPGKKPWPGVGPRTTMEAGRIYSKQAPGGIFTNADIENFVEQSLPGLLKKHLGK